MLVVLVPPSQPRRERVYVGARQCAPTLGRPFRIHSREMLWSWIGPQCRQQVAACATAGLAWVFCRLHKTSFCCCRGADLGYAKLVQYHW